MNSAHSRTEKIYQRQVTKLGLSACKSRVGLWFSLNVDAMHIPALLGNVGRRILMTRCYLTSYQGGTESKSDSFSNKEVSTFTDRSGGVFDAL